MKKIKKAKEIYNNIEVPLQLNEIINLEINKNKPKYKWKYLTSTVASVLILFVIGVNVSETFAMACSKIPIISEIVSVISIHGKKIDNDKTINTQIPQISTDDENIKQITDKVNNQIKTIVDEYTKQAEQDIQEYKEAFIETGGTEEEFKQKNIVVDVSYDLKSKSKDHISLVLNANEGWANAYNISYFYNIDLNTGKNITLKDILGDDYINIANESIKNQIEQQIKEDENLSYFGYNVDSIDGFKTITDETNFYINKNGNPVIVFDKYEIVPGYMGQVSFEINKNK
ncbi:RsiV family protein [[Clostridium] colinum]|uniref:RsiV family protein n=1 Tax=[Clostridium] colinum TaxID=36835 RepID=UPI002024B60D|nr:RsiV family protein [[Clostridium] colinum]